MPSLTDALEPMQRPKSRNAEKVIEQRNARDSAAAKAWNDAFAAIGAAQEKVSDG